jgi:UTP--glucose-1-phosphate uridylyltransferase
MKAVVTIAGEGTRMLPVTLGMRKEMLPLFYRGQDGIPVLAPVAHLVVDGLYRAGATNITMVVGRDVENVLRYFTPDSEVLERHAHQTERLVETLALQQMLYHIHFTWVVQSAPRGFGDALQAAEATVGKEGFVLNAADAILLEPEPGKVLREMAELREKQGASVVLFVRHVANPKRYGVVEGRIAGKWKDHRFLEVKGMEEKPERPKSEWAATALYAFSPEIFDALRYVERKHPKEVEVTAGISHLIEEGHRVLAMVCRPPKEVWVSVGSPEGYFKALRTSYKRALRISK